MQPVTVNDAPALASVMTDSRWADPHWKALFEPSTTLEQVTSECAARLPWNLVNNRATKRHEKAIDAETGEVVGYARWILPTHLAESDNGEPVWKSAQVDDVSAEDRGRFERDFAQNTDEGQIRHLRQDLLGFRNTPLVEADRRFEDGGPCLSLDYLSTAPLRQRQGVGALMLQSGLEVADAYGLKTIVTASPAGLKLYLNHGFELLETVSADYSRFGGTEVTENHFMIRRPLSVK